MSHVRLALKLSVESICFYINESFWLRW